GFPKEPIRVANQRHAERPDVRGQRVIGQRSEVRRLREKGRSTTMTVSFLIRLASRIYAFTSDERGRGAKSSPRRVRPNGGQGAKNAGRFSYQSIGYLLSRRSREHGAGSGITREQITDIRDRRTEVRDQSRLPRQGACARSQRLLA